MTHYDDGMTLRAARGAYFEANRFGPDGGYEDPWILAKLAGLPIAFPNLEARRQAVRLHDLHHLVTGYETTLLGESEIGAWELGSGCKRYWAAWVLDLASVGLGFWLSPRRALRALALGRRTRNLYGGRFDDAMLDRRVGDLKRELGLDRPAAPPEGIDLLAYLACLAASAALAPALILAPVLGIASTIARGIARADRASH